MNIYVKIILLFLLFIFIYWLYKKYKINKEKKHLESLIIAIKNNITITLYNINKFVNLSSNMKKILLEIAKKYNHDDIIKILSQ